MPHNRHAGKGHFSMVSNATAKYMLPVTMEFRAYKVGITRDVYCPNCASMQPCDAKESWHTVNVFAFKVYKETDEHAKANMVPYYKCTTCKSTFPKFNFEGMSSRGAFEYVLLTAMIEMRMRSKVKRKALYRWSYDEAKLVHQEYLKVVTPEDQSKVSEAHVMERGRYIERIALYRDKGTTEFFPPVVAKLDDNQKRRIIQAMEAIAVASKKKMNQQHEQEEEDEGVEEEDQALVDASGVRSHDRKVIEQVRILLEVARREGED